MTPGQELHLGRTANSITVMFQLVIELCKLIIVNNITPQTPSPLSPEILQKVYEGAITLSPAVELSYLSEEQQKVLLDAMSLNDCTPSHAQSIRMKNRHSKLLFLWIVFIKSCQRKKLIKPSISALRYRIYGVSSQKLHSKADVRNNLKIVL